jgi:hypothetical protein
MNQPASSLPNETPGSGEVAPESEDQKAKRLAIVEAFAEIIKVKRSDAIEARRASGIEKEWQDDEDQYDGIDDANRGSARMQKGRTPTDGLREPGANKANRSTVFLRITRPYVDAASARVSDMLLPSDDRNFALKPEPRPDLTSIIKEAERPAHAEIPPQAPVGGLRGMMGKLLGGGQSPAAPGQSAPDMLVVQAKQAIAKAKASAERAQEEIDDYLVESRYHAEVRKVIESAARVGTGILKGPHPVLKRSRMAKQTEDGSWQVEMVEKIAPASKAVNHWNFYPDGNCGENIHNGSYVFESDDLAAHKLRELKKDPSYLAEMIDLCLDEGPISAVDGTRKIDPNKKPSDKDLFQIWYFHGQVSKADMEAAGCKCGDKDNYPAVVTMVNDRVIKATMSPLDSGEFPYDVMVWQTRTGSWAGVGVSNQMRECQKGANAAVRNLMDNAGLGSGPQIIVNRNLVVPANGKWEIAPRKVWWPKLDTEIDDVRKAFMFVTVPMLQPELMAILQFWLKEAEDVTGLPMLLQGQQGDLSKTLGETQILNNNGSTVLRRIARTFDDRVTEPHIGRYYEWVLLYGPDEAKGQFTIDARGSSALVERDMQAQQLVQMMGMSLNPAYGLDPELVASEFLKSMRFDPKSISLSDEKKQEMASRQPPEDPRIAAAKIMAKSKEDAIMAGAQMAKAKMDLEARNSDAERQLKRWIAETDAQLATANLSADERTHLDDIKATLTGIALKLRTQTDLSIGAHAVDIHKFRNAPQVISPVIEPQGRAPAGQAFQK